ncbi:uncharacterized protein L3040_002126 [Drepanopeziza brunnea f. sp. 'multigermtubi']|uniref:Uncharacterized protein n=1 Tax=Marssonina brunnea f. sp. multigermtubi (strain MB_m1) TaxID=1072389 RepID=K1Y0R7_MARBU|nr:uncharacterized protein MBM_02941 [Drepanopeziza brunnea f. sp. 'multigermtubi' MB_m1]EKD18699.1 hypothetical protein MBM_02941 [Drepanopeziza brunnea f. sp. 'multigermtubi' MB_m1]KAJ5052375.1 hypothetical protein L3040_002126 [Drepanopeziza brunnea f. sp. 'multigermtubi']
MMILRNLKKVFQKGESPTPPDDLEKLFSEKEPIVIPSSKSATKSADVKKRWFSERNVHIVIGEKESIAAKTVSRIRITLPRIFAMTPVWKDHRIQWCRDPEQDACPTVCCPNSVQVSYQMAHSQKHVKGCEAGKVRLPTVTFRQYLSGSAWMDVSVSHVRDVCVRWTEKGYTLLPTTASAGWELAESTPLADVECVGCKMTIHRYTQHVYTKVTEKMKYFTTIFVHEVVDADPFFDKFD